MDIATGLPIDPETGYVLDRRTGSVLGRRQNNAVVEGRASLFCARSRVRRSDPVIGLPIRTTYYRAHEELAATQATFVAAIGRVLDGHPELAMPGSPYLFHPTLVGYLYTAADIVRSATVYAYPSADGSETSLSFTVARLCIPFYSRSDRRKLEGVVAAAEIDDRTYDTFRVGAEAARRDFGLRRVFERRIEPLSLNDLIRFRVLEVS